MADPTPGVVLSADSRAQFKEWVDRNPLRTWRHAQDPKLSILESAERLGVGMSMVQMYERGVHKPGAKSADRFAEYLGADWSDRWDAWLAARPAR